MLQNGNSKNGLRNKDLLNILSQKNTKEELTFLKKLIAFMEKRNTPIERPPMLGFKQSEYNYCIYLIIQHFAKIMRGINL